MNDSIKELTEGDLVIVFSDFDERIKKDSNNLVIGTFLGYTKDKMVQVLLQEGWIFLGANHKIVLYETQAEEKSG